jgi:hypothetical protein
MVANLPLEKSIVGMAATSDGGIFRFKNAVFYGLAT